VSWETRAPKEFPAGFAGCTPIRRRSQAWMSGAARACKLRTTTCCWIGSNRMKCRPANSNWQALIECDFALM
jgi:hypothetical protein